MKSIHGMPTIKPARIMSLDSTAPVTETRVMRAEALGNMNANANVMIVGKTRRSGAMPLAPPSVIRIGASAMSSNGRARH